MKGNVGAHILNILTESLYDKPLVVFREYVQNAIDSFKKIKEDQEKSAVKVEIWKDNNTLYFLDNGAGIVPNQFLNKMTSIGASEKSRVKNIGYKGIGRLSGISYCKTLDFINIIDFNKELFQKYTIDCEQYRVFRNTDELSTMGFFDLLEIIGQESQLNDQTEKQAILSLLNQKKEMFSKRNQGFLVIMNDITGILNEKIDSKNFLFDLGWLLPVNFKQELLDANQDEDISELIESFMEADSDYSEIIPADHYVINYDGTIIERPIRITDFRLNKAVVNMKYAKGFFTFSSDKIAISQANAFNGIRIYLDNMLLCDEKELIPALIEYGLTTHTHNELIQSVRGIGAILYIVDKVAIVANARRTFLEVTDIETINLLQYMAEWIDRIYQARYALSKYQSGKRKFFNQQEKLEQLKNEAQAALDNLVVDTIIMPDNDEVGFDTLSLEEKKRAIKNVITAQINQSIRTYLKHLTEFKYETAYQNYLKWLFSQEDFDNQLRK